MRQNKEKKEKSRYTVRVSDELSEFIDKNADERKITSAAFIRSIMVEYKNKLQET